jgi:hypothetical protein
MGLKLIQYFIISPTSTELNLKRKAESLKLPDNIKVICIYRNVLMNTLRKLIVEMGIKYKQTTLKTK